jgi:hypothetical protein
MKTPDDPLNDPQFADVLARLREQAAPEASADFARLVLDGIRRPAPPRRAPPWAIAAALALLFGAGAVFVRAPSRRGVASNHVSILMAAQRSDGSWGADATGTPHRNDVGVTALALLALMHAEPSPLESPQAAALRAGLDHLLDMQQADGRFGTPPGGLGHLEYLAGNALRSAAALPGADPAWREAAARAEPHLPPAREMARLNRALSRPDEFPDRWMEAGGPSARAAVEALSR